MKRQKFTKIIITVLLAALALCPIISSAEESGVAEESTSVEETGKTEESTSVEEAGKTEESTSVEEAGTAGPTDEVQDMGDTLPDPKTPKTDSNPFQEIYDLALKNADKIFSVLAFLGTLIVGIGYKSGLLPLLRDALSRLKTSIEQAKESNDKNSIDVSDRMTDLTATVADIGNSLKRQSEELSRIEWQFESYEALLNERAALRTILEGQIDMLYSIFMSTSLPQYQKDEIGERIAKLKEELKAYEIAEN